MGTFFKCNYFFGLGLDKALVISVTNALVTSPLVDFNSAIASSRVNPFLVMSLIDFSGNGDGARGVDDAAG